METVPMEKYIELVCKSSCLLGYVNSINWDGEKNLKGWLEGLRKAMDDLDAVLPK